MAKIADRVVVMRHGEVVEAGLTAEVLANPRHDYTRLLLDSVPEMRTDWLDGKGRNRRQTPANQNSDQSLSQDRIAQ